MKSVAKHARFIFLLVLVLVVGSAGTACADVELSRVFESETGLSFRYPADWELGIRYETGNSILVEVATKSAYARVSVACDFNILEEARKDNADDYLQGFAEAIELDGDENATCGKIETAGVEAAFWQTKERATSRSLRQKRIVMGRKEDALFTLSSTLMIGPAFGTEAEIADSARIIEAIEASLRIERE